MPKSKKKGQKKDLDYYIQNFTNYNVRIPWNIFVKILVSYYGCEMESKPGVARLFIKDEARVTAHEPHGREKFVSKKDRERVVRHLINKLNL